MAEIEDIGGGKIGIIAKSAPEDVRKAVEHRVGPDEVAVVVTMEEMIAFLRARRGENPTQDVAPDPANLA
jgi:hypothetical protein